MTRMTSLAPAVPTRGRTAAVILVILASLSGCARPDEQSSSSAGSAADLGAAHSIASEYPQVEPTGPASPPGSTSGGSSPAGVASVSLFGPLEDAPGAVVPFVATVHKVPSDRTVRFEVRAGGQAGRCFAAQWTHSTGRSQECWVVLPKKPGRHQIQVSAQVSRPGGGTDRVAGQDRPIVARGSVTDPVLEAERDRIRRCGNTTDQVWLTFDDGFLSQAKMDSMLATLQREKVRARFFATGQWSRDHPQWMVTLRKAGHLIENHTSTHEWLNRQSDALLHQQIAQGPKADEPRLLRPGFGAGAFSATVKRVAESLGQRVCYWTVDTRDWAGTSAAEMIAVVMNGNHMTAPLRPGGIVLMHMTGRHTAEALPGLIASIRSRGMQLEPLH